MGVAILVGTRKGLFAVRENGSWSVEGPLLKGFAIYHAIRDPRDGTFYACSNYFGGASVHRTKDLGGEWERADELGLPEESGLKLNATWHVEPGADGTLWLGGDPGVLFRSDDGGRTWEPNRGVLEHPTREQWGPGAGGLCCHSIQVDDAQRMAIAISAAGAFRTDDGGETWQPMNKEVAADFMPDNPYPEVGQCVHKLLIHPARRERWWQQNHCGVYRSDDRGETWERLDGNGLPSDFGFALALDARDPDTAYVIPEEGADNRLTPGGRLSVWRTRDAGASWEELTNGLPEPAFTGVLREAAAYDDDGGVYFGTQNGAIYASRDGGESWVEAARDLPQVLSVETWR